MADCSNQLSALSSPKQPKQPDTTRAEPEKEVVAKPKRKAAPKKAPERSLDLKQKHTCGACGKTMSLHTALYGHTNCPSQVSVPQPHALVRQPPPEPEPPQPTHAQLMRMQLAQAAQERRAQAQRRMTAPIRNFYGL